MLRSRPSRFRFITSLLLPLSILLLGVLPCQSAQGDDTIGIYWDAGFTQSTLEIDTLPATVTGYLVLSNVTSGYPIYGWECCVGLEGSGIFTNWQLEGQTVNVLDPPCFMVGIGGTPLPNGQDVLLATFEVLLTDATPQILTLNPVNYASLPDQMAYLSGPAADDILPMFTDSGFPQVATINGENPVPMVSPEALFFDVQPIGTQTILTVTVSNIGGGYLYLDVSLPEGTTDFSLPQGGGPQYIGAGNSTNIQVAFSPGSVGAITSVLNLGPSVSGVPLHGVGREPIISYTAPDSLDFGDPAVGVEVVRNVVVTNTGEVPILVAPSVDSCPGFTLPDPDSFTLQAGATGNFLVQFSAPSAGSFDCEMQMGEIVSPIALTAQAHDAVISYTVSPDTLDFGSLAEGTSRVLGVSIYNNGEAGIAITPYLDDPSYSFDILGIDGNTQLQPGGTLEITVIFQPEAVGQYAAELTLGDIIPPVPLMGSAEAANPQCQVNPPELDFGETLVGSGVQRFFTVTNTGNVPLEITPYEDSDHFFIQPYPVTINPGTGHQFMVVFSPQAVGSWDAVISLGGPGCPGVYCYGSSNPVPPPGDTDLVGIFFDPPYYNDIETYVYGVGLVESYLVIKNVSVPEGVLGWECRHEIEGPALFVGSTLMGQALNVGTLPDFIVGLSEPLPPSPDVLLAQFSYFVFDVSNEIRLNLQPVTYPSIPDRMAFLSGADYNTILPMDPFTGSPLVAFINSNPLDVERPLEPQVQATGGQVQLSWTVEPDRYEGYHVYRRDELGDETRLTGSPEPIEGSAVIFTDQPQGFDAGVSLFYSYSLVEDGVETPRSPEVEIQVQNVPASQTRLLPNIPNPFNPQTEIRFQLAQEGPVRVSIFDVAGKLVRVVESGRLPAGNHERVWQGKDSNGRQVPSGAYYLRLETSQGIDHRKIMLLK